jgi:hypothetical protein
LSLRILFELASFCYVLSFQRISGNTISWHCTDCTQFFRSWRQVILKGVPVLDWVTEDFIFGVLQKYGLVKTVKLFWAENGGRYGFVWFTNPGGAQTCLKQRIELVAGEPLRLEQHIPQVSVRKMEPYRITDGDKEDLCAHFAKFGEIQELKIKGSSALLSFRSMDNTATVLSLRNTKMNDGTVLQITDRDEEISSALETKKSIRCRYWDAGRCARGSSCWYLHPNDWYGPR